MSWISIGTVLGFLWIALLGTGAALAEAASPLPVTDSDRERFLRHAETIVSHPITVGRTRSRRVTLRTVELTHDAHVQTVDIHGLSFEGLMRLDLHFADSYKSNVAAYLLDRMLGIRMTPVTVMRELNRMPGSFTWWVDDPLMTERERTAQRRQPPNPTDWEAQIGVMRVFDQLIRNDDRNLENIVIDQRWKLWMIDHTRAFRIEPVLSSQRDVERIDRRLFVRMKGLTRHELEAGMRPWLRADQIDALLARRDLIVQAVEGRIRSHGEKEVLYDWLRDK